MTGRACAASDEALRLWLAGGITKTAACIRAGVSRPTLDRAIAKLPTEQRQPQSIAPTDR